VFRLNDTAASPQPNAANNPTTSSPSSEVQDDGTLSDTAVDLDMNTPIPQDAVAADNYPGGMAGQWSQFDHGVAVSQSQSAHQQTWFPEDHPHFPGANQATSGPSPQNTMYVGPWHGVNPSHQETVYLPPQYNMWAASDQGQYPDAPQDHANDGFF
jgi:hypothetical protein